MLTKYVSFLLLIPALLIGKTPSSVTLTASAAEAQYGSPVTFTATVSPSTAMGEIEFRQGVLVLEVVPLSNGTATFTTSLLPSGKHSFTAYYPGNATYANSRSAPVQANIKTLRSRGFTQPIKTSIPSGNPSNPAVADFNGDGFADFAISSGSPNNVEVFLGNGDGTFQSPVVYAANLADGPLFAGDFNGDGKPDLLVASGTTAEISVLLGNGDGTFRNAIATSLPGYASGIATGDFNRDGRMDVVITDPSSGSVFVLLGNGDGTFQVPSQYAGDPSGLSLVDDFNGDGKADIAFPFLVLVSPGHYKYGINILFGIGDGTFMPPFGTDLPYEATALAAADFNGDGKADLALLLTGQTRGLGVLLGNGDGTFEPLSYQDAKGVIGGLTISDFNGDGKADMISASSTFDNAGAIVVSLGNGDGTFQTPLVYKFPGTLTGLNVAAADLNRDGRPDFLGLSQNVLSVQFGSTSAPTTTTMTSSQNPSFFGFEVTLTATVKPPTVSGSVSFYDNGMELGTAPLTDGTASLAVTTLLLGTSNLTATYNGDTYEFPSTSVALSQQVDMGPTSTTLLSSLNPSMAGQAVTLTAEISPSAATGNVTFYDGSTIIGNSAISGGEAMLTISTLSAGTHNLTATYTGSADYNPSVSFIVSQVVQ